jgi:hypothetical protein
MMLVETELRPSPIHGIGVFLLQPVSKGDLIWRFDARIDRVYTRPRSQVSPSTCSASCAPTRPGTKPQSCGCSAATMVGTSTTQISPRRVERDCVRRRSSGGRSTSWD